MPDPVVRISARLTDLDDLNRQDAVWIDTIADVRVHVRWQRMICSIVARGQTPRTWPLTS